MKVWYTCPICGQKLCMIDDCKDIEEFILNARSVKVRLK